MKWLVALLTVYSLQSFAFGIREGSLRGVNHARGSSIQPIYDLEDSSCYFFIYEKNGSLQLSANVSLMKKDRSESNGWLNFYDLNIPALPLAEGWQTPLFTDPNEPEIHLQHSYKDGFLILKKYGNQKGVNFEITVTMYIDNDMQKIEGFKWKAIEGDAQQVVSDMACGSFPGS